MNLVQISSTHDILSFFVTSILSSIIECLITCIVGGSTVSAVWHLAKGVGFEEKSISFYIFIILISTPTICIALFWFKVLFIPSSRGKLSIFSPFFTNVCQISFRNDDMVTVVAGTWLILWTFLLSIGWSFSIRRNIIHYKIGDKFNVFPNCCYKYGNSFQSWFQKEYIPSIVSKQHEKIENRKFLVFQPSISLNFEQKINGLLSSFALAIITDRELLIDWPDDMDVLFKSPGWIWKYSTLFPQKKWYGHVTFDFVTPPSFIVPPAHKWRWSDLLQSNVTKTMFHSEKVVMVNIDEFIAPLLWANPVYRQKLCQLTNIDQIYSNFASVLLVFNDKVVKISKKIQKEVGSSTLISIADSSLAPLDSLNTMTSTLLRCMGSVDNDQRNWLIVKKGSSFLTNIKWTKVGDHNVYIFNELECLKNVKSDLQLASLFHYSKSAEAILGFTGSKLAESIAFGYNKSLYMVLHRIPFCSKVAIRLPCVEKWPNIVNSKGIDLSRFMVSEMNNFMHCQT